MIKIEIIDPARENPDMLVKIAALLMECAGHSMVKAPPENLRQQCANEYVKGEPDLTGVDASQPIDLSKCTGMGILKPKPQHFEVLGAEQSYKPCVETYENPPYQHCAESDLTHALGQCIESVKEANNEIKEILDNEKAKKSMDLGHIFKCEDAELPEHSHGNIGKMTPNEFDKLVDDLGDALIEEKAILSEKPKSATKRKRAPKFEVIKETGVTEVEEDLINIKDHVNIEVNMSEKTVVPKEEPIENIIPPSPVLTPMVNGNTLVDKILMARTNGLVTHEEITAIVKKHGIVAIKDIFVNDHLIPLINTELDELLRSK